MAEIVSWLYDFGDGETSTSPNPDHVYAMPGEYYATETVTDADGNTSISAGMVYVYNFDYRGGVPNASLSTKCYRIPVRAGEGFGVSEYMDNENPGADWIWPPANIQIGKGFDLLKREIALVLDSKTQREYQINDEETWLDRSGAYAGSVIKSEIHQRSVFSSEGEHIPIRHIEHHLPFKSFDRKNMQNVAGYDDVGLPIGFQVDNQMFQDGEPFTPVVEAKKIPIDGDLVFQERVEARNLQLRSIMYGAPYWLTGILPYYETVDKSGVPSLKAMTEDTYQSDMASMPMFRVSRNYDPLMNLATGAAAQGTYASLITGPDGRDFSALRFTAGQGLTDTMPAALTGDFTAYLWVTGIPLAQLIALGPVTLVAFQNMNIAMADSGGVHALRVSYNGVAYPDIPLSTNGLAWTMLTFVRDGLTLKVYENKALIITLALASAIQQGSGAYFGWSNMSMFDPCVLPRAVSLEAISYYYDDIIRGGEQVLQPF